jgi:hypothetical protein
MLEAEKGVSVFFFKAFAILVSFVFSISFSNDRRYLNCRETDKMDEGLAVTFDLGEEGTLLSRLFSVGFVGEKKLAEYPCFDHDRMADFRGEVVLRDCYLPESWDQGFDVLLVQNPESGNRFAYIHELGIAGPILRGRLSCEGTLENL